MRKIIVSPYITLDGVMQAPGGPEKDFKYGGWSAHITMKLSMRSQKNKNNQQRTFFWAEKPLRFLHLSFLNMKTSGLVSMM